MDARAFFALSQLDGATRGKSERGSAKKNEREKAKAPSAKEKKLVFSRFLPWPHHIGNPVPEPKATRQGEKQGS
jgi:hypothetical protein